MANSDKEQKSIDVPQHKRIAQGEKLDGTSYRPKGTTNPISKSSGGLGNVKKQK